MKKLLYLALAFMLAVALCACGEDETTGNTTMEKPSGTTVDSTTGTIQQPTTTGIPEHIHNFGAWEIATNATCTEDGLARRDCSCGEIQEKELAATGHTEVTDKAVAATCTETGLTEGKHCSVCNEVLIAQTKTTALGHEWKSATCSAPETCTKCGATNGSIVAHSYGNSGTCTYCGKQMVSISMKIPRVGTNNYYVQLVVANHSESDIIVPSMTVFNGKLCYAHVDDIVAPAGKQVTITYYRAIVPSERFNDKYCDMYLDNNSTGYCVIYWHDIQYYAEFGVNGITVFYRGNVNGPADDDNDTGTDTPDKKDDEEDNVTADIDEGYVYIYNNDSGLYVTEQEYQYVNASQGVEKTELVMSKNSTAGICLYTRKNSDDTVTFVSEGGKYLYCDGTNVRLSTEESAYTKYYVIAANGGYYIKCATATYGGTPQYLELYSGYLTCYRYGTAADSQYVFNFLTGKKNNTDSDTNDKKEDDTATEPSLADMSIKIHYYRADGAYDEWGFWIWEQNGADGSLYSMEEKDDFGGVMVCKLSDFSSDILKNGIGIIPRRLDAWIKDGEEDRLVYFSYLEMDEDLCYNLYIFEGDINVYVTSDGSNTGTVDKDSNDIFTVLKNYVTSKGTYDKEDNEYRLTLGYTKEDGTIYYRSACYEIDNDCVVLELSIVNKSKGTTFYLGMEIKQDSNGAYDWGYVDGYGCAMLGTVDARSFDSTTTLKYTYYDNISTTTALNSVRELASTMMRLQLAYLEADLSSINFKASDLYFYKV